MEKYLEKIWKNLEKFYYLRIEQIPREQNSNADALEKLALQNELDELNLLPVEVLDEPSICEKEEVEMTDSSPTWMTPIVNYLLNGKLPADKSEARKFLYTVPRYMIVECKLYQSGYSMPLLQCVLPTEANEIIKEINKGFCGDHADLEPLVSITYKKVLDFVVKNIIRRFGISVKIVFDERTQFDGELFTEFCERNKIIKIFSLVSRPQENGQVEAVNKTLKDTIKKKLDAAKGRWVDELPLVLWANKKTKKIATRYTPFSVAFGSEAMLPVEVNIATHKREFYDQEEN
ncbi:hypothetical protein CsatB_017020 [Cannabis sativa]